MILWRRSPTFASLRRDGAREEAIEDQRQKGDSEADQAYGGKLDGFSD